MVWKAINTWWQLAVGITGHVYRPNVLHSTWMVPKGTSFRCSVESPAVVMEGQSCWASAMGV